MALTNAQYDEIMRGYDKRQLQNKYIHDKRIEEAYRKAPRLREIDSEIASASVRQAYRLMDGDENALAALRLAIEDYKEERAALLSTLGYPLDYFEPIYTCPDCHDTGYIDGQKCHCFKQAIINTVYSQSNICLLYTSNTDHCQQSVLNPDYLFSSCTYLFVYPLLL